MEFGNVAPEELQSIDFTLPRDPQMTTATLQSSNRVGALQVHVGCTKWTNKEWTGYLYPNGTKDPGLVSEYSKQFNTIEFGPTFYTIYTENDIRSKWASKVDNNPDFKFCPRMAQRITHLRRFKSAEPETKQFFDSLSGFDNHLGPILMQVGDPFTPKYYDVLSEFLPQIPKGFKVFTEVRHKDWFANMEERTKFFNLLQIHQVGAVITDTPGRRDCVHMQLPIPHAMIRFVGNNGGLLEKTRLDEWIDRIKQWSESGLQSLWFFMHQHDELYTPFSCRYLIRRLNEKLGLNIKEPIMYEELQSDNHLNVI
jgi:uncharacterized protein YecE (DUF72 family)